MATTQFCLTNAGNNLVGPNVSLLSNLDNFVTAFQTDITLNSLQSPNCPATITVPDGATQIRVFDPNTNQCATVNLEGNDLCTLFNLTIDTYQSTTISQIIFGTFTTSFGPVNDYLIYWYRNNETTPQYISGKGTLFAPYGFTHPLTGAQAILAQSGEYSIKIAKIQINGLNFSTLDTPPAGFIKATTSCIPTVLVQVSALSCNGSNFTPISTDFDYPYKFEYNNASVGTTPQSLSATFDLSINTNYIAYYFNGFDVYDILKITFYGDNYSDPIVIENISVGLNASTTPGASNVISNKLKNAPGVAGFKKVLNLSTLIRSQNDYLTIEVNPNPTFNQTIWLLYLKCLNTINCTDCTDQFINQHPKIYSVDTTVTSTNCQAMNVSTKIQACSRSQVYSDIRKYLGFGNDSMWADDSTSPPKKSFQISNIRATGRNCSFSQNAGPPSSCSTSPQGTTNVSTSSSNGVFTLNVQFSNSANFNTVVNNFISELTTERNTFPNYQDPLNPHYLRYITFAYPTSTGCGDGVSAGSIVVPLWSTYVVDNATGTLTITFNLLSTGAGGFAENFLNENSITNCDINCSNSLNQTISFINSQPIVNFTNTSGGFYSNAFAKQGGFTLTPPQIFGGFNSVGGTINMYSNLTYMFSGNPLTLINTTPIKTCDFELLGGFPANSNPTYNISSGLGSYNRQFFYLNFYPRVPFNPTYTTDFTIFSKSAVNGLFPGNEIVAYQKFDGVITTDNNFVI